MVASIEERNRVLGLVEAGHITALQAAQLLDALLSEPAPPTARSQNRVVRLWVTDLTMKSRKVNMTAITSRSTSRIFQARIARWPNAT